MARFNTALTSASISGTATIGSPGAGAFTNLTGTAPYTVTVPNPTLFPGVNQQFYNATSGTITLTTPSGNFNGTGGNGTASMSVFAGNVVSITSDGAHYVVISEDGSALTATTGSFSGNVTMNGSGATVSITPSTLTVAPTGASTIDAVAIGSTTRAAGAFTSLAANAAVTFTANTASSSTGTGTLVVTGGLGVSGQVTASAVSATSITGTLQTASQPNITSTGALTAPSIVSSGTLSVNGATNTQTLTVNGGSIAIDNAQYLYSKTSAATVTRLIGINSSNVVYMGSIDTAAAGGVVITNNGIAVTVLSNGNVGVGATNPIDIFQVQKDQNASTNMYVSNATAGTAARSRLIMASDASAGSMSIGQHSSTHSAYPNQAWVWASGASTPLVLGTVGTPRVTIDVSGNVTMNTAGTTLTVPNQNSLKTTATVYPSSRPNLVLDFANSKGFDARITFTRNSVGSYYDENGILRYAAANQPRINYDPATLEPKGLLIEEARTNLITFSDHLSNSYWTTDGNGFIRTNGGAPAPDGTMCAEFIREGTGVGTSPRFIKTTPWSTLNNTTFTFSLHVKTSGAKRNMFMLCQDSSQAFYAHFDIVAGTVVASNNSGTGVLSGAGIQNAGNGWFRIWISGRIPSTAIYTMATLGAVGATGFGATTYTGDGVSGFSLWGAQIEVGAFPTSYIQSTPTFWGRNSTATYYDKIGQLRIIETNRPRYHHVYNADTGTWSPVGLLIENAATNLLTSSNLYADTFSGEAIWTKTNSSTDVPAPDGSGTTTKAVSGTSGNSYLWRYSSATYAVNSTYTTSFWCRTASGQVGTFDITAYPYNSINATVTSTWTRFSITYTPTSGTAPYIGVVGPSLSTTFYFWGWQVELGTSATSYIPTAGATVTRTADFVSESPTTRAVDNAVMFNMGSVLNSTQGTVISTWESQGAPTAGGVPGVFELLAYSGTGGIDQRTSAFYYGDNYALSTGGYTYNSGYTTRAIAYQSLNTKVFVNGALTSADTTHSVVTNLDKILLGGIDSAMSTGYPLNGHIKRLVYYPKRLTDTEVIALTTQ